MKPFYEDKDSGIVIYHGDSRDILPQVEADVLLTDPDYGVGMNYGATPMQADEADQLLVDVLRLSRVTSGHGLIFWSGSWRRVLEIPRVTNEAQWPIRYFGIWNKPNGAGTTGNGFARRFETWYWLDKGIAKKRGEWNHLSDCLTVNRVASNMHEAYAHPSQKPTKLVAQLMRFFSVAGDTILEPYMGSGTALRVAKELGRRAIGIDINGDYCEMAAQRLSQTTRIVSGQEPIPFKDNLSLNRSPHTETPT